MPQSITNAQPARFRSRHPGKIDAGNRNPYDPASWGTLYSWYNADYGITLDGSNNVTTWIDKSINHHIMNSLTAGDRPAFLSNQFGILNEFSGIQFADPEYLYGTDIPATGSSNRAIIIIIKDVTENGSDPMNHICHWGTNANDQAWGLVSKTGGSFEYGNHYWADHSHSLITPISSVRCIIENKIGDYEYWYQNGVLSTSVYKVCNTGSTYGMLIGSRIDSPSEGANFCICELMTYSNNIDADSVWPVIKAQYGL
jgi:hypothetical protein